MILEVGSGVSEWHKPSVVSDDVVHIDISKFAKHLEVQSDCHFLPFRDRCFEFVICKHVSEHCNYPLVVLRELARVCNHLVMVVVPNALFYSGYVEDEGHIFSWTPFTFEKILGRVFRDFKIDCGFSIRRGKSRFKFWLDRFYFLVFRLFLGYQNELIAFCYC